MTCGVGGISFLFPLSPLYNITHLHTPHQNLSDGGTLLRLSSFFLFIYHQITRLQVLPTSAYIPCRHRRPFDIYFDRNCFGQDTSYSPDSPGHRGRRTLMHPSF